MSSDDWLIDGLDEYEARHMLCSEYCVTFFYDYSRKTWIYFLKTKSEVFRKFKEFKASIENHSERRIKILRSDNG